MKRIDKIQLGIVAACFAAAIIAVGQEAINDLTQKDSRKTAVLTLDDEISGFPAGAVPAFRWNHHPGAYEFDQIVKANP